MWEPEPDWHPLPGGTGTSTVGVWRAALGDQPVVVKRLARARRRTTRPSSATRRHFAYWRREADVAHDRHRRRAPRACGRRRAAVEEDVDGITITREWVEDAANSGLFVAMALGRFAGSLTWPGRGSWPATSCATGWPGSSAAAAGRRWPGPPVADVADHLWRRRDGDARRGSTALPQVPQHGDPVPANLPGRERRRRRRHRLGDARASVRSAATSATTRSRPARSSSRCSTPT